MSVRADVVSRYAGFFKSLLSSPCNEVGVLARVVAGDVRSTTAKNLRLLDEERDGVGLLVPTWKIREKLMERKPVIPVADAWRVRYLGKLLEERDKLVYEGQEQGSCVAELQELINSLCIN